jgi:hypothetical protein
LFTIVSQLPKARFVVLRATHPNHIPTMAVQDNIKESIDDVSPEGSTKYPSNGTGNDKEAFLSSFTAAENKAIMRKVDRRFLLIIGVMYLIKNVTYFGVDEKGLNTDGHRLTIKMLRAQRFCKSARPGILLKNCT